VNRPAQFKDYLAPLLKWWWLILIALLVSAASAFVITRQLPPVYSATTTLAIGHAITQPNPSSSEFSMSQQLARVYADIAQQEPVRNATSAVLGIDPLPDYEVKAMSSAPLLEITVTHTDPRVAQAVANELANQLIIASPTNPKGEEQQTQAFVQQQIAEMQAKIGETNDQITAKQTELAGLTSANDIEQAQQELAALENKLTTLQTIFATLVSTTSQGAINTIAIFNSAALPSVPIGPNKPLIILLAAVGGLALATVAAYAIELLDDTFKSADDVTNLLQLPVIGYIAEMPKNENRYAYVSEKPRSAVADAFRLLRTNLEFYDVDRPIRTLLVTGFEMDAGKSTISTNLAMVVAQADKKVILVDADLRKPTIQEALGIWSRLGLTDVSKGAIDLDEALVAWNEGQINVLPSGSIPPNPTELLGSLKMKQILTSLKGMAEMVVVDGPPFTVADAAVLAARVDGILIVIRPGHTHKGRVLAALQQIQRSDARVIGVVLNRVSSRSTYYGRYYGDYQEEPARKGGRGKQPAAEPSKEPAR
jgi:non-specific protein-tyrosine kinase